MDSWKRLTKTKEFKKISKGYFRALEITRKIEREDYHPHIHVIIVVNKSYFGKGINSGYITQKAWREIWQKCAKLDYDPWVDIRMVKEDDNKKESGKITYAGAVSEVAKYTVKGSQVILDPYRIAKNQGTSVDGENYEKIKVACQEYTDENVKVLDEALKGRRLVAFGGKMKEVHKLLNLKDPIKGDLVNTDNDNEIREDLDYIIRTYEWQIEYMNYVLVSLDDGHAEDDETGKDGKLYKRIKG
jgi:plasmid rolling circle replication initiator protein Rep